MSGKPSLPSAEDILLAKAKDIPDNSPIPHKNPSAFHIRRKKLSSWDDFLSKLLDSGNPSLKILIWAAVNGVLVGAVVGLFRLVSGILVGYVRDLYDYIRMGHWWWLILIVAVSLAVSFFIAWIIRTAPLAAYSGAADVEARLHSFDPSWWNWWRLLWRKFIGGTLALSSGLYLGCEGPSIQMGATVGLALTGCSDFTKTHRRQLVAAGLAAGLAAAFTAPIAATLFLIEGDYLNRKKFQYPLSTILASFVASVASGYITLLILGTSPDFILIPPIHMALHLYWELIPIGLGCGILGYAYEKTLAWGVGIYDKLHIPHRLRMFIPLVLSIPIGLYLPATLGDGSFLARDLSVGAARISIWLLLIYIILRLIFAQISYGSGAPSGIFLPICSLGIIYGIFCGKILASLHLAPASLAFYSLIGVGCLGGLFGSVIKKPLTAVLLAVEVTSFSDLRVIAIITVISYFTTGLIDRVDKKAADERKRKKNGADSGDKDDSVPIQDLIDQDDLTIQDILDGTTNPNQEEEMYDN
ncbi:MAG: chloride channel protein [Aeriscardovia sp.]|nr:chloride channel protein [Aeriscardovia sp.]